ncbi:hypothetical protein Tco_0499451 [Tanacetum coccineum]
MFEREKLSGTKFNDWFRSLKMVLRVEKKMFVIEQPIPPAPAADSTAQVLADWNAVYDAHNKVACLMLGSMTPMYKPNLNIKITKHGVVNEDDKTQILLWWIFIYELVVDDDGKISKLAQMDDYVESCLQQMKVRSIMIKD